MVSKFKKGALRFTDACDISDSRYLTFQYRSESCRTYSRLKFPRITSEPVHSAGVFMELIITQFIPDPEQDENAASHADGQSGNIDQGKGLMPDDIPDGNFQVIE